MATKKKSTAKTRAEKRAAKKETMVRLTPSAILASGDLCNLSGDKAKLDSVPAELVGHTVRSIRERGLNLTFWRPVE